MAGEGPKAAGAQPSDEGNPALPHSMPSSSPVPPGLGVMQHPAKPPAVNCSSPDCSVCLGTAALSTLEGPRAAPPLCCATWILGDGDPQGLRGAPCGSHGACCLLTRADRQGWHWAQHLGGHTPRDESSACLGQDSAPTLLRTGKASHPACKTELLPPILAGDGGRDWWCPRHWKYS